MYWVISTERLHKMAPMINSQKRNVNEALRRSGKDTTPGPDRIWYSEPNRRGQGWAIQDTQKALTKAIFPKTGQTASWDLFPNKKNTTRSWMDTAYSQSRTPLGSSWNALLPGNSPETSTTRRYSLQIRVKCWGSDQDNAHGKMQLHLRMTCRKDSRGKNKQWL